MIAFFLIHYKPAFPKGKKRTELHSKSSQLRQVNTFPLAEFTQITAWMAVFACVPGNLKRSRLVASKKQSGFLIWSKDTTEIFKVSASTYSTLLLVENPSWNTAPQLQKINPVVWVRKGLPKTLWLQFKKTIWNRKTCFPFCNWELLKFRNCCCYFTFYYSLEAAFKGPQPKHRRSCWMLLGLRDGGRKRVWTVR